MNNSGLHFFAIRRLKTAKFVINTIFETQKVLLDYLYEFHKFSQHVVSTFDSSDLLKSILYDTGTVECFKKLENTS
jgi:hypothetical protein